MPNLTLLNVQGKKMQTLAQWALDATVYPKGWILMASDESVSIAGIFQFKIANGTNVWTGIPYYLTEDILDAIYSASTPSSANPFATMGDLPSLAGYLTSAAAAATYVPLTSPMLVNSRKLGWASGYAPPNLTTVYFGDSPTGVPNGTATNRQFRLQTGVIRSADFSVSATGVGSNEAITFNLRNITDGTSTLIYASLTITATTKGFVATGLSVTTNSSKEYAIEMVTPTFGSPHAGVALSMTLNIFNQ